MQCRHADERAIVGEGFPLCGYAHSPTKICCRGSRERDDGDVSGVNVLREKPADSLFNRR
jgi:hypothetical protein